MQHASQQPQREAHPDLFPLNMSNKRMTMENMNSFLNNEHDKQQQQQLEQQQFQQQKLIPDLFPLNMRTSLISNTNTYVHTDPQQVPVQQQTRHTTPEGRQPLRTRGSQAIKKREATVLQHSDPLQLSVSMIHTCVCISCLIIDSKSKTSSKMDSGGGTRRGSATEWVKEGSDVSFSIKILQMKRQQLVMRQQPSQLLTNLPKQCASSAARNG